jgi:putative peptidoglycan binding protein
MSRSLWAAAGAVVFAIALTPGEALATGRSSSAARSAGAHERKQNHAAPRSVARVGTRRRAGVLLQLGSGYRQANGSGRVRALQRGLARVGDRPGPFDGLFGPRTTRAVMRFQRAHGLPVDGIAGPKTLTRLRAALSGRELTRATRSRSARPAYIPASASVSQTPVLRDGLSAAPLTRPLAVSHAPGTGQVFRAWMILAALLAAAVMVAATVLRRRYVGVRRRRRYISPQKQSVVRWVGFRYSRTRKAYVLRLVGNFIGPVLKTEMSLPTEDAEGPLAPVTAIPAVRRTPSARSRHATTTPGAMPKRTRTGASRTSKPRT